MQGACDKTELVFCRLASLSVPVVHTMHFPDILVARAGRSITTLSQHRTRSKWMCTDVHSPLAVPSPLSLRSHNPTIAFTDRVLDAARRGRRDVFGAVPSLRSVSISRSPRKPANRPHPSSRPLQCEPYPHASALLLWVAHDTVAPFQYSIPEPWPKEPRSSRGEPQAPPSSGDGSTSLQTVAGRRCRRRRRQERGAAGAVQCGDAARRIEGTRGIVSPFALHDRRDLELERLDAAARGPSHEQDRSSNQISITRTK
ncbi:hypothetical protein DFH09DRAFT_1289382 [Mycena vulgaris]|nr:hypothetical protein DFH09DRAFT_1289382 [Mycena vulgaris]